MGSRNLQEGSLQVIGVTRSTAAASRMYARRWSKDSWKSLLYATIKFSFDHWEAYGMEPRNTSEMCTDGSVSQTIEHDANTCAY